MTDATTFNDHRPRARDLEAEAREAQARLDHARARMEHAATAAQRELRDRATRLESESPSWEVLQRDPYGISEILVVPGGFFVRSIWQRAVAPGQPQVQGAYMGFVAGEAPRLVPEHGSIVVAFNEVRNGVAPHLARLSDLAPCRRYDEATEILLRLPDGGVRLLKPYELPEARPEDGVE